MKRLILIAGLFALASCKKETPSTPMCQCREVTFIQGNQGYWTEQSSTAKSSMDCGLNGTVTQTWNVMQPAWVVYYKKQIVCD
jgi:hypothetical protein